MTDTRELTTQG